MVEGDKIMDEFLKMRLESAKEQELYEDMMENALHVSKLSNELVDRAVDIKCKFTNSLISIGIDPTNKDLLEVIADLADELNRIILKLNDLQIEFYNFQCEVRKELN